MADAQSLINLLSGIRADGGPLIGPDGADYRRVDFLADYEGPAASGDPKAAGTYGTNGGTSEGPNTARSILDGFTTLAKLATRRYVNAHGQRLDFFDLLVANYQAAGEPVVAKGPVAAKP